MSKRCPACERTLDEAYFGRNRSRPDGLSFYCLACNRARNNRWYRDHRRAAGHEVRDLSWVPAGYRWCPRCKQAVAHEEYARNSTAPSGFGSWCKRCRNEANNDSYWIRTYGITKQAVAAIRVAQDDRCAICGDESPQHLDHDHDLGTIRALLCQRCNHGLGLFRDEPGLLHTAALYVSGHREQHALAGLVAAAGSEADGPADVTGRR